MSTLPYNLGLYPAGTPMQVNCIAKTPYSLEYISQVSRVKAYPLTESLVTFAFVVLVDCGVPEHIEPVNFSWAYVLVIRPPFPSQA